MAASETLDIIYMNNFGFVKKLFQSGITLFKRAFAFKKFKKLVLRHTWKCFKAFLHWLEVGKFERRQETIGIRFQIGTNSKWQLSKKVPQKLLSDAKNVAWKKQGCFKVIRKFLFCLKTVLFLSKAPFSFNLNTCIPVVFTPM